MFLSEPEQALLSEHATDRTRFAHNPGQCIVADWQGEDNYVLELLHSHVERAGFTFTWEMVFKPIHVQILETTFEGETQRTEYGGCPLTQFQMIQTIRDQVRPALDVQALKFTLNEPTYSFLIRPVDWWQQFEEQYPETVAELFVPLEEAIPTPAQMISNQLGRMKHWLDLKQERPDTPEEFIHHKLWQSGCTVLSLAFGGRPLPADLSPETLTPIQRDVLEFIQMAFDTFWNNPRTVPIFHQYHVPDNEAALAAILEG